MKNRPYPSRLIASLLFCAVLSQASLPPLAGLPSDPPDAGTEAGALSRLLEISTRLGELNEALRNELENSRRNSAELSATLETSRRELDQLKAELEPLRMNSTQLLETARNSTRELNGLREALRKAESSLMSLELSWEAYRISAESRIAALERRTRIYRWALIAAGLTAAGGWTAWLIKN
jgi:septal ring factor EnvC (AmiA/AmiB activator)